MDVELGTLVRKTIAADPKSHNQMHWAAQTACGTVMCVAGHTVAAAGYSIVYMSHGISRMVRAEHCCDQEGNTYSIPDKAAELLGIARHERMALFHTMNNSGALRMLDEMISESADG